jgi:hypothetical protein
VADEVPEPSADWELLSTTERCPECSKTISSTRLISVSLSKWQTCSNTAYSYMETPANCASLLKKAKELEFFVPCQLRFNFQVIGSF